MSNEFKSITQKAAADLLTARPSSLIFNGYLPAAVAEKGSFFTVGDLENAAPYHADFASLVCERDARPARRRSFGLEFYKAPARYRVDYSDGTRRYFENPRAYSRFDFAGVKFSVGTVHGVRIVQAVFGGTPGTVAGNVNLYAIRDDLTNDDAREIIDARRARYQGANS